MTPANTAEMPGGAGRQTAQLSIGRSRAAVTGLLWSALNTIIATGTTAAVFLVTSTYLTPVDFGIVALAASVVAIVGCLAPAALGEALVQRREITAAHLDTVFWTCGLAGLILYLALALSAGAIGGWSDEPMLATLLPFIGLRLLLELLTVVPNALIVRQMKFRYVAIRTAIANTIGGIACITLVIAGFGLWALAASLVLTPLVALIVMFPVSKFRPGMALKRQALRDLLRYGIFASGNRLLNTMNLDQLLIGFLGGPAMLGLYFFAKRLLQLVTDVTAGIFLPVSHALLSSMQTEPEKRREAFLTATYGATIVGFPAFAGLIALAPEAVPLLFGAQWVDAVPAVQALAGIGLMASIGAVQAALINSQGKTQWWFAYQCAVHGATVPLVVFLYDQGLSVLVYALLLRTMLLWPISVRMALKLLDMPLMPYLRSFLAPAIAAAAMVLVILTLPNVLPDVSSAGMLSLQILTGALVYLTLATSLSLHRARRVFRLLASRKAATA